MNATPNKPTKGFINRRTLWIAGFCAAAAAGIGYAAINGQKDGDPLSGQPAYEVQQGPLSISITVAGTIQAREKVIIKNELEGSSTILYLVPEGTRVKKGDLLVELDASSLVDQKLEQEIKVQNAEAAYINARENLAIVESQAQSDIDQAELTFDFAKQDLKKYIEGDYPMLKQEAQSKIAELEENLTVAQEELKWSKILFDEKYLSQSELQTDELQVFKIQNQLDLARSDLELLENFVYQRDIAQLESDEKQAEMALERTKRQAGANIVQASAELQAKLSEFEQQKSRLDKIVDQISKAKIEAPMDGLVVYATSVRMGWRGNDEPLEEGQQVRERQELIHLPTTASYAAEAKVHESSLEKIRVGLPVRITIDALPGKTYTGRVASIAPLPDAQSVFMNPDLKVYDTVIHIEGDGEDLRSGMGCQAEIIVDYFEDAVYIPVQAVLRVKGQPTVFVSERGGWVPRPVELGPDNNRLVQIPSGLEKGELVLLTPPLASAGVSDEERFKETEGVQALVEEAKANPVQPAAAAAPEGAVDGVPGGGRGTGGGRPDFENMTPEQREQMRQRFQNRGAGGEEGGRLGGGEFGGGRGGPGGGRPDSQNMTPEQREQMRQRFQNMTPEEREALRGRFQREGGSPRGGGQDGPSSGGEGGPGGAERP